MAKQELLETIRDRYQAASRKEKSRIFDEFIAVTGHHRKHGIRLLGPAGRRRGSGVAGSCRYGSEWYALVVIGTIRLRLLAGQHQDGDARLWLVEPWFRYHPFMSRPKKRRRQPDQSSAGPRPTVSTYQTRIAVYEGRDRADGDAGLSAYAELYGKVQRKLFSDVAAGRSAASLKSEYIKEHGIPGRMFNGVRVLLEGKVSAVRESQRLRQDSLRRRLDRAERQVAVAAEQGRWQRVHPKRRRLANLQSKLAVLEADIAAGRVRLCFGSKKLWRKRHHLETNGSRLDHNMLSNVELC